MARDKRNHAREHDVLVDDQDKHRHLWEEIGGVFIHHKNARQSIEELKAYFPGIVTPAEAGVPSS